MIVSVTSDELEMHLCSCPDAPRHARDAPSSSALPAAHNQELTENWVRRPLVKL